MPARTANRPRVVIVGGGFGGLSAAKGLADVEVDVTLVDRINHHLFQPLLYQVATGILSDGQIAPPLRSIFSDQANLQVRLAEVTGFDLERRAVYAVTPDGEHLTLPYEYLIVAAGSTHAYFGHDEWERFAPGLKSLTDAHLLRARILGAFELGAEAPHDSDRERWLTFVIVGAGPTGVELTGQIAELSRRLLGRMYGSMSAQNARIVLLDAAPTVLGSFPKRLQEIAHRDLAEMGVEIRGAHLGAGPRRLPGRLGQSPRHRGPLGMGDRGARPAGAVDKQHRANNRGPRILRGWRGAGICAGRGAMSKATGAAVR